MALGGSCKEKADASAEAPAFGVSRRTYGEVAVLTLPEEGFQREAVWMAGAWFQARVSPGSLMLLTVAATVEVRQSK